jgi:hypothetical protein
VHDFLEVTRHWATNEVKLDCAKQEFDSYEKVHLPIPLFARSRNFKAIFPDIHVKLPLLTTAKFETYPKLSFEESPIWCAQFSELIRPKIFIQENST